MRVVSTPSEGGYAGETQRIIGEVPTVAEIAAEVGSTPTQSEGSAYITVSSGAGAELDGAYVEFFASSAFLTELVNGIIRLQASGGYLSRLTLAIGAGGSEVDVIEFLPYAISEGSAVGYRMTSAFDRRFRIAAAQRVSLKARDDNVGARGYDVQLTLSG